MMVRLLDPRQLDPARYSLEFSLRWTTEECRGAGRAKEWTTRPAELLEADTGSAEHC